MNTLPRLLGFIFGEVVLLGCLASNLATVVRYFISKKRGSMIPFVGGVAGAIGLWVGPFEWLRTFWWLTLVIDPGCVFLAVQLITHFRRGIPPGSGGTV